MKLPLLTVQGRGGVRSLTLGSAHYLDINPPSLTLRLSITEGIAAQLPTNYLRVEVIFFNV